MSRLTLRGIGWDHERCLSPLRAAATAWAQRRPDVSIEWDARPLEAFNDQPLGALAERYDLLVIDHPFVGAAAELGCLAPLERLLGPGELGALAADAIGESHDAYGYAGSQWALAVDGACQVAAARDDLLADLGCSAPAAWRDVHELARANPGRVAMPLDPTDAICSLLTICASSGVAAAAGPTLFLDPLTGERAVSTLTELVPHLHPASLEESPPALLERMGASDVVAYVPLVFGYVSYACAQPPGRKRLRFLEIPSAGRGSSGSILGGAGLAVSAASAFAAEAAAFAAWACGPPAQVEVIAPAGGQPASRTAWVDPGLDAATGCFFSGTRRTIESAWVRPRDPWWPGFQRVAGELLAGALRSGATPRGIVAALERVYREHRPAG
ncbi:MAG: extracellular solute-binding protein [Thermoleophilia bacterium]|nr:extracellular solute-binding protein [Thermoleophilia bacterium]